MTLTHSETQAVDLAILASYDEAQIEGEPDFVVELIDLYLNEVPRLLASMRNAITGNDRVTLKRTAHSLRGSSANLGVVQMAAIAGELEHCDPNNSAAAPALLLNLENEFERVKETLNEERRRRFA